MIPRPTRRAYLSTDRLSLLEFPESDGMTGRYHLRGGVCWPTELGNATREVSGMKVPDLRGFILVLGQDIDRKRAYVFEQTWFDCVDPMPGADGRIEFDGVSDWINRVRSEYYCDTYYWSGTEETRRRFELQVIRSEMLRPTPHMVEVPFSDPDTSARVVMEWLSQSKLFFDAGSDVMTALQKLETAKDMTAPAWALMCAVCGMERFPWRARR